MPAVLPFIACRMASRLVCVCVLGGGGEQAIQAIQDRS